MDNQTHLHVDEEPLRLSDLQIVRYFLATKLINTTHFDVWYRAQIQHESIYSMRHDYPREFHRDKFWYEQSLSKWVRDIDKLIAEERLIMANLSAGEIRERYKIAIAQGHDVRDAGNPTAQGRRPDCESSWDTERLMAAGYLDRYSRKRA